MEPVRIATAALCVLLLLKVVLALRREHIRVEYSMTCMGAICLLLGVSLSDFAMNRIADLLQVRDAAVLLLLLAGVLLMFKFFSVTVQVSMLKDNSVVVSQKLGILEWTVERQAAEIQRLEAELATSDRADRSGEAQAAERRS